MKIAAHFYITEHGTDVALTFFDLRKAFDSVPHLPLLQKLKDIGLEQHILQWLTSYLSDRQQHVVVDGATSNASLVLSGVPQGSVLSPLPLYLRDQRYQCMQTTFFSASQSTILTTMMI